jgi:hypothetical protein
MKNVIKHIKICKVQNCTTSFCRTSKELLQHCHNCIDAECYLCKTNRNELNIDEKNILSKRKSKRIKSNSDIDNEIVNILVSLKN